MQRTIRLFAALLTVQLVAAIALYWHQQQLEQPAPHRPLLAVEPSTIDRLVISDGGQALSLQREAEGWRLPERENLPANAQLIDDALDTIHKVTTRWPVATTQASHQRFEVSDETFQRHVRLYAGDEPVGDFFLGTSPAFRQVHLRRAGEEEVYTVDLNVTSLPAGADAWLDSTLLAIANPERIEGPDFVLQLDAQGDWRMAGATEEAAAELDRDMAGQLAGALANLRVQSIVAEPPDAKTTYTLRVTRGNEVLTYRFFSFDDTYYVQRDDLEAVFSVSQYDFDRITAYTR